MSTFFNKFYKEFNEHLQDIYNNHDHLFTLDTDKDELWGKYLDSFPEKVNPVFRERREMDCSACRQFVKAFGNVVYIGDDLRWHSIWGFPTDDKDTAEFIRNMRDYVGNHNINNVFYSDTTKIGQKVNYEKLETGDVLMWKHLYTELPERFKVSRGDSVATVKGHYRARKDVFKRALEELSSDATETVLELIAQNSLYKGKEWENHLKDLLYYQKEYSNLTLRVREVYLWKISTRVGDVIGKIKNHSIGVLLEDISKGMDLNDAVTKYERMVAPENYKRPKPIYSKQMLKEAQEKITELGYLDSLPRRFANIDDISVKDLLFVDRETAPKISDNVFDEMEQEITIDPKKFNKVEEVPIKEFIKEILPKTTSLEILFENKHINNLVSLIAPVNKDSPSLFKWDNSYSWAYKGNVTDSIKQRVHELKGKIDGVLNFRLAWNFERTGDDDLDAHCTEPDGNEIYYGNMMSNRTGGVLDVDIINPMTDSRCVNKFAVENITYPSLNRMIPGKYLLRVHQFTARGDTEGFQAEIEFDNELYEFYYPEPVKQDQYIEVAEVTLSEDKEFSINELLKSTTSSREVWNINTNQFVPVSMIMFSPNQWEKQGLGNEHLFIMLKDCVCPDTPNGFYNEYLKHDLVTHKRFFEALGTKMKVEASNNQLSGLGFSSTLSNELIVRVKGKTDRVIRLKF